MRKRIFISEYGGKKAALEKCKELVLNDMRNDSHCLIEQWDGKPCNVTPEEHFDNIVNWCKTHIKSTIWSCQPSAKSTFWTSYGAKHRCESYLKCYVANNWMKVAMLYAGLEIRHKKCVDYDTGYVSKNQIILSDLVTNNQNFIVRATKNKIDLDDIICDWTYELKYSTGGYDD